MTARALAGAVVLFAAIGVARADDAYTLPPVGAQLTYRLVTTIKLLDRSRNITVGQVYTYGVTSVDGPTAEATITPTAVIYGCSDADENKDCAFAAKAEGATRNGDLVTVPVPNDIGAALAKQSELKTRYFVTENRKFPMPGPKNPDDPGGGFGDTPIFLLTSQLVCDYPELGKFFPLGKTQQVTLSCHNMFSRTQARIGPTADQNHDDAVSLEFSYGGAGKVSLPSGEWDTQKVALKFAPTDTTRPQSHTEYDIATKIGLAVRMHNVADVTTSTHITSESTSELIAYKP